MVEDRDRNDESNDAELEILIASETTTDDSRQETKQQKQQQDSGNERGSSLFAVYGITIGYCLSASLLSIINKWAIVKFPYPGLLTALQYLTSTLGVWTFGRLKLLEHEPLELGLMWRFLPAAVCFYASLFTNSELLLHANVDTFIVFRSAVPILVALGETLFLGQAWPLIRTWLSLGVILVGAIVYVIADSKQLALDAYGWALAYLISMTVDFVYIKHIVMTIGLSTWGLVLYNNLEALLLFPIELLVSGEGPRIKGDVSAADLHWNSLDVWLPVSLSCLLGLSISFFGFSCRRSISATSFTVLGVVNKLLTVVINLLIWSRHASAVGTAGLLTCIAGGIAYQQSLQQKKPQAKEASDEAPESEDAVALVIVQDPKE